MISNFLNELVIRDGIIASNKFYSQIQFFQLLKNCFFCQYLSKERNSRPLEDDSLTGGDKKRRPFLNQSSIQAPIESQSWFQQRDAGLQLIQAQVLQYDP